MNVTPIQQRFDFQKLEVYRKAQIFHVECNAILRICKYERHVKDQLARASYSIVLNIAEGSGRMTPNDRRHFFTIARASIFECVAIFDIMLLENQIDSQLHEKLMQLSIELSKMLFAMIRNLIEKTRG
jgi:four helix bundle protein